MSTENAKLLKFDSGKLRYELIDPYFIKDLAAGLTYGAVKYAPNNWRNPIEDVGRLYGALMRHCEALRFGEMIDTESKLPHTALATCELMFLRYHLKKTPNALMLPLEQV